MADNKQQEIVEILRARAREDFAFDMDLDFAADELERLYKIEAGKSFSTLLKPNALEI